MLNRWENVPVGSWITLELVGYQSPRRFTLTLQHFAKKPFSSLLVPTTRHQDIQDVAILIDSTPEIPLLSSNLHEQLVNMPSIAQLAPLFSEGSGVLGSKLQTPEADGFVRNNDATLGEEILDITEAKREPMVQPNGMADYCGRKSVAFVAWFHAVIVVTDADCDST